MKKIQQRIAALEAASPSRPTIVALQYVGETREVAVQRAFDKAGVSSEEEVNLVVVEFVRSPNSSKPLPTRTTQSPGGA